MSSCFSIIIPVYNSAKYLRECLDSVLAQQFPNWEIICVNDGSTDGSDTILYEYAAKDTRITAVNQANEGVSKARNVGLERATGEWFLFLDADDALSPYCLSSFQRVIEAHPDAEGILTKPIFVPVPELSVSDWREHEVASESEAIHVNEIKDRLGLIAGPDAITGFIHGRVYRRTKFGLLRFPVGIAMLEDIHYWVDALSVDAKWYSLNQPLWAYRQYAQSVSHGVSEKVLTGVFTQHVYVMRKLREAFGADEHTIVMYWNGVCGFFKATCIRMLRNWNSFSEVERRLFFKDICATYHELGRRPWFVIRVADVCHRLKLDFVLPWLGKLVGFGSWLYWGIRARMKKRFKVV